MSQPKWVATDSTGSVIASLTSLVPSGPLRRTIGRYESQTFTLTVDPKIDPDWDYATTEGQGAVIGYTGEPGSEVIEWGGIITRRKKTIGNVVEIAAATPECYLDARHTGDYVVVGRDQNLILSDFITLATLPHAAVPGSTGWPFEVQVVGAAGVARDRTYADADDKTLYSVIDELAHVDGGPQWTIEWQWRHNPERIVAVAKVGTRIGTPKTPGMSSPVAFTPRMMLDGTLDTDYASGRGANVVTAVSSGTGTTRPSQTVGALQPHRPVWEHRYTPATDITDPATLTKHAQAQLAVTKDGAQSLSFSLDRSSAPRLGVDWFLGDDMDVTLDGPTFKTPVTVTGQCIGYEITADTITPYLAADGGF